MSNQFVSLKQLAEEFGIDRSNLRKYVIKMGIEPHKRRTPDSNRQLTLAVTADEAETIRERRREQGFLGSSCPVSTGVGVFYVVQLVPELDPQRIKFGYTEDIRGRLSQHRTSAPTAKLIKTWPCRKTWENTIIDCLVEIGCKLILNEVYECADLGGVRMRGDAIFELLPHPEGSPKLSQHSPHNLDSKKAD